MILMTNEFFLDLEAVLALDSHASLVVLAVVDASVAEAAVDAVAADAVEEDVADAAGVDAAAVNQLLEYRFQLDPCTSQCRGLFLYIRDKVRLIR
jgi:hypothetical protein